MHICPYVCLSVFSVIHPSELGKTISITEKNRQNSKLSSDKHVEKEEEKEEEEQGRSP